MGPRCRVEPDHVHLVDTSGDEMDVMRLSRRMDPHHVHLVSALRAEQRPDGAQLS